MKDVFVVLTDGRKEKVVKIIKEGNSIDDWKAMIETREGVEYHSLASIKRIGGP
ncbi:hypothetical protein [Mammaliicoccus sciuri]|uniref:hypothetical protein n=1 Tax=Mammaliicoccus sciuri TaxID=1296 RepID=UPI002737BBFC|nr:hypothetical protein [Mammaliicoccus sciuri]